MSQTNRRYVVALARGFAGAIIFSIPLLMTMEMWWLGFYMDSLRLALFLGFVLPLLVGLAHVSGFEPTRGPLMHLIDGMTAYLIALVAAALVLTLFTVVVSDVSTHELVGKLVLQASAGSFGAILAHSQLAGETEDREEKEQLAEERRGYGAELLLMSAGALFLAMNVAPTEEVLLIAVRMGPWPVLGLMLLTVLLMHAFVYAVEFRGQEAVPEGTAMWTVVLRFTFVGYALALLIAAFVLWCFGRLGGLPLSEGVLLVGVLAFPAAIGAASARLIL